MPATPNGTRPKVQRISNHRSRPQLHRAIQTWETSQEVPHMDPNIQAARDAGFGDLLQQVERLDERIGAFSNAVYLDRQSGSGSTESLPVSGRKALRRRARSVDRRVGTTPTASLPGMRPRDPDQQHSKSPKSSHPTVPTETVQSNHLPSRIPSSPAPVQHCKRVQDMLDEACVRVMQRTVHVDDRAAPDDSLDAEDECYHYIQLKFGMNRITVAQQQINQKHIESWLAAHRPGYSYEYRAGVAARVQKRLTYHSTQDDLLLQRYNERKLFGGWHLPGFLNWWPAARRNFSDDVKQEVDDINEVRTGSRLRWTFRKAFALSQMIFGLIYFYVGLTSLIYTSINLMSTYVDQNGDIHRVYPSVWHYMYPAFEIICGALCFTQAVYEVRTTERVIPLI
jgi:hypothetical protein